MKAVLEDSTPLGVHFMFFLQLQFHSGRAALTKIRGLCIWAIHIMTADCDMKTLTDSSFVKESYSQVQ